jgi:hypothetical protein
MCTRIASRQARIQGPRLVCGARTPSGRRVAILGERSTEISCASGKGCRKSGKNRPIVAIARIRDNRCYIAGPYWAGIGSTWPGHLASASRPFVIPTSVYAPFRPSHDDGCSIFPNHERRTGLKNRQFSSGRAAIRLTKTPKPASGGCLWHAECFVGLQRHASLEP